MKRLVCVLLAAAIIALSLAACGVSHDDIIGSWRCEITVDDLKAAKVDEAIIDLLTMITGSTVLEINVDFKDDGSFRYEFDLGELQNKITESANKLLGVIPDSFAESVAAAVLKKCFDYAEGAKDFEGDYMINANGRIVASDVIKIEFEMYHGSLYQLSPLGKRLFRFDKIAEN